MTESQNRLNDLNECIRNHLGGGTICLNACELRMTSDSGCGVFATQDICANDVLFVDKPLVLGPTGNQNEPIVCVMCYEIIDFDVKSHLCSGQCGLILCGKIECFEKHKAECLLFQKWKPKNPNELSFTKCKALLVIRSLFLNEKQRKFLDLMQKHGLKDDLHFANEFVRFPQDKETVGVLSAASAAMNVNAFKIPYRAYTSTAGVGVRGFFPIMSLINHKCSPNARPDIDRNFVNRVLATVPIRKNEQIFITYSQLLWATNSRRMHMMASKQFLCICNRCIDPTEFSTNLSAIKCQDKNCNGIVLPIESINFKSDAKCNECQSICDNKRFLQIQEMTARITKVFVNTKFSLDELKYFVEMRLHKLVPDSNQFVFEAKLKAVWKCEAVAKEGIFRGSI